jgi:hypothetical protein
LGSWSLPVAEFSTANGNQDVLFVDQCAPTALASLRSSLRDRLRTSDLLNCRQTTVELENAFRAMLDAT